jgi:hypothetical protein
VSSFNICNGQGTSYQFYQPGSDVTFLTNGGSGQVDPIIPSLPLEYVAISYTPQKIITVILSGFP